MASEHVDENIEDIEEDDQFIDDNDVVVEIGDNGDVPMDEDDYDVPPGEDGEEVAMRPHAECSVDPGLVSMLFDAKGKSEPTSTHYDMMGLSI